MCVSLGEQELLIIAEHMNLLSFLCGVRGVQYLVFCALFCISLFIVFSIIVYIHSTTYGLSLLL